MASAPRSTGRLPRRISEVARHLILPSGIVATGYPPVLEQCRRMGVVHDDWQQGLGKAILSKRSSGLYAAGIGGVIISICRQVGKTFTIGSIIFALCVLFPGTKVLWTAHRARTSDETFKSLQGFARRKLVAPHVKAARQANGQQEIEFHNGSRILFGAREAGFGRGFDDVDMLVFDEAQILGQKALDDMVPSTNVAANPLIVLMGTPPKPGDPSEVFAGRRAEALEFKAAVARGESPHNDTLYVEVSADPDADSDDRKQWAKGNPSYPMRTPESAILRMKKQLGDESFRREGMGIWDESSSAGVIPLLQWSKNVPKVLPEIATPFVAVDVRTGLDQSFAIAIAGRVDADRDFVDVLQFEWELRPSRDYIVGEIRSWLDRRGLDAVSIDSFGDGNGPLLPLLEAAGVKVLALNTADMRNGSVGFKDAVLNGRLLHPANEYLTAAVKGVGVRKSGEGFIFSQDKSLVDVTPLRAVTAAWWSLQKATPANYDPLDSVF